MAATSPAPSFDPEPVRPWWKDSSGLTEYLREVSLFFKNFRSRLKVGELSRSPLRLLSFNLNEGCMCCDWIAREPDAWDSSLPAHIGQRHASLQAIKDAIDTRSLLFESVPQVDYAQIRAYRRGSGKSLELIISGGLRRQTGSFRDVHSLVMRAKLLGFRFALENDVLAPLTSDDSFRSEA